MKENKTMKINKVNVWAPVWGIGTAIVMLAVFGHPPFWIAVSLFLCGAGLQTCGFIMARRSHANAKDDTRRE
jgi:hypothetical protein